MGWGTDKQMGMVTGGEGEQIGGVMIRDRGVFGRGLVSAVGWGRERIVKQIGTEELPGVREGDTLESQTDRKHPRIVERETNKEGLSYNNRLTGPLKAT